MSAASTKRLDTFSGARSAPLRQTIERPSLAPVTIALVWNGAKWTWAIWTGVEWTALPWTTGNLQPAVATTSASPNCGTRAPALPQSIAGKRRHADTRPSVVWLVVGHIIASLMGLALGYYIVCRLRPAEFTWPLWPLSSSNASDASGTVSLPAHDETIMCPAAHCGALASTSAHAAAQHRRTSRHGSIVEFVGSERHSPQTSIISAAVQKVAHRSLCDGCHQGTTRLAIAWIIAAV